MILEQPLVLLFSFTIGLYPLLYFISKIVTNPLSRLRGGMDSFKKGDFNQKLEVTTGDEIGQVTECFNDMVDEIRELINKNYIMALKEKESELTALQAQINPHFLYNTLDALYWQAQNGDNEELITEYLHVQKMRFSQYLEYEICIAEEIRDIEIPKLILQPFVENAIVHGFEKKKEGCKITVSGSRSGDWLKFVIEDTGTGMDQEQVAAIFEEDTKKRYSGQRVGRYAVKNVKERLELKYHDNFMLDIASEVGKGTQVTIQIPLEEGDV